MAASTAPAVTVSPDGSHLRRGGRPWPYVVDTAWSAFADVSAADWAGYLDRRRAQGFTGVAISVLPVLHDRSLRPGAREPFALDAEGRYDLSAPSETYFATAESMVAAVVERDMVPTLAVLWCSYVPETWVSAERPWAVMTPAQRASHVSLVARRFARYRPVFSVSGDDRFTSPTSVEVYREVLGQLAEEAPDCLTTAHLAPDAVLPDALADSPDLDLVVYQSGHDIDHEDRPGRLAEHYRGRPVRKPVVNLEPPYEFHGYGQGAGRFSAAQVRRASWESLLGGASAGIGYGAHGVWQWHVPGAEFTNAGFSLEPAPWWSALRFGGADDIGLLGRLWSQHQLYRLGARQDLLGPAAEGRPDPGSRVAADETGDLLALYLPFSRSVLLRRALGDFAVTGWDLERRLPFVPVVVPGDQGTVVVQPDVTGDAVIFFERRTDHGGS